MDDDDTRDDLNPIVFLPTRRHGSGELTGESQVRRKKTVSPATPRGTVDTVEIDRVVHLPGGRLRAAIKLWKMFVPVDEIAELLDYESGQQVQQLIIKGVGELLSREDVESMRARALGALEHNLQRSIAFADADYFEDRDGNQIPNNARLAWHKEVRADVDTWARISGASAPAQLQLLTPESQELDEIVRRIEAAQGDQLHEADVIVLEVDDGK